jgi:hypothetical protein
MSNGDSYAVLSDGLSSGDEAIVWVDAQTGNEVHQFVPDPAGVAFEAITPVGGAETIAFLGEDIFLYNLATMTVAKLRTSPFDPAQQWLSIPNAILPSPFDSAGEIKCQ